MIQVMMVQLGDNGLDYYSLGDDDGRDNICWVIIQGFVVFQAFTISYFSRKKYEIFLITFNTITY